MTTPLTPAPTLETERLILRGPKRADLEPFARWLSTSPRMEAQGELGTEEQAWYFFLAGIGHWQWLGYGFFILTLKGDDTAIGRVGLLGHRERADVELAWHIFDAHEGKGYVTEAATAVRAWAYETIKPPRLVSYIHTENLRSQAVAKRLGATTVGARAVHDETSEIWEHAA